MHTENVALNEGEHEIEADLTFTVAAIVGRPTLAFHSAKVTYLNETQRAAMGNWAATADQLFMKLAAANHARLEADILDKD